MSIEIKNSNSIPTRSDLLARVVTTEEIANKPTDVDADYLSSQAFEAVSYTHLTLPTIYSV